MRDYAVRVTHPDRAEPLILPTPQGKAHAAVLAAKISGDSTAATAEVVSRPSGAWEPEP